MAREKKSDKPAPVPQAKGSVPGDNGADAALEASNAARFAGDIKKLMDLAAKIETLRGQARNIRKDLKRDIGVETFEVDFAIKLKRHDEAEMVNQRRREERIARWLEHPIGTQANMFVSAVGAGNGKSRPFELGRLAGAEGAVCKPPPNLHQDDAQRWITGWQEGQAALAKGIRAPEPKPDF
jgi:hypothetical protein